MDDDDVSNPHDEPRHEPDLPEADDGGTPATKRLVMSRELRGWIAGLSALLLALTAVVPGTLLDGPHEASLLSTTKARSGVLNFVQATTDKDIDLREGETRNLVFEFTTTNPAGSVFEALFTLQQASVGACTIGTSSSTAATLAKPGQYIVYNPAVAHQVLGAVPDTVRRVANANVDFGELFPSLVRIDLAIDVAQDAGGKQCLVDLQVVEDLPSGAPFLLPTLTYVLDIIKNPPIPVLMGAVETEGGPWRDRDEAKIVIAAPQNVTVLSLLEVLPVPLIAAVNHHDGADNGDYGLFWFTINGTQVSEKKHKVSEPHKGLVIMDVPEFHAGGNGKELHYEVCLHARYVDDGWYKDTDGEVATCSHYRVLKVDSLPAVDFAALALGPLPVDFKPTFYAIPEVVPGVDLAALVGLGQPLA